MPASSPSEASAISTSNPRRCAQRRYIRSSISAQSCESVPPAPLCTETAASPESYRPWNRRSSSSASMLRSATLSCSRSSVSSDSSSAASSARPERSSTSDFSAR